MFQYTREFIINDNGVAGGKGLLSGKSDSALKDKRFAAVKAGSTGYVSAGASDGEYLMVAKMANLCKDDIKTVHRTTAVSAENAFMELDLSTVAASAANKIVRLVISIREEGKVTALVNDQYPWHTKQYFYEGLAGTAGVMPIATWVAEADKEAIAEAEDRLINVVDGESGKLKISANDCYTRIHEVRIVEVPAASRTAAEALTGYQDYKVLATWTAAIQAKASVALPEIKATSSSFKAGTEGAGTVAQILKNMRLLSDAHLDPYGLQRDERPLPTGKYDQFTIECVSERRHIGGQVFGEIDHSLTTYVFFVESTGSNSVADAFDAELVKLGCTVLTSTHTHSGTGHDLEPAGAAATKKVAK